MPPANPPWHRVHPQCPDCNGTPSLIAFSVNSKGSILLEFHCECGAQPTATYGAVALIRHFTEQEAVMQGLHPKRTVSKEEAKEVEMRAGDDKFLESLRIAPFWRN